MRDPADPGTSCPAPGRAHRLGGGARRLALRSVVVLGGVGVLWWLMAGVSQAADGPAPELGAELRSTVASASGQQTQARPDRAVAPAAKATIRRVAVVRRATPEVRPVREVVRVVRATPAAPVVEVATRVVRQVRDTVEPVRPGPGPKTHDPVEPEPADLSRPAPTAGAESRAPAAATSGPRRTPLAQTSTVPTSPTVPVATDLFQSSDATAAAPTVARAVSPDDAHIPRPVGPCVNPALSGNAAAPWAVAPSPALDRPAQTIARTTWLLADPAGDPAYPPGSSPD